MSESSQSTPPGAVDQFDGDQFDLEARLSLRRVAGLGTELEDVSQVEYRRLRLERVVLAAVGLTSQTEAEIEQSLDELARLAETAGSQVLAGLVQRRASPDPATFIGRGKVVKLAQVVAAQKADTVICDGELSQAQLRNLEDRLDAKVIDRTALILDIFAQHARSAAGQAQVELAQLQYLRQRLRGWGGNLSRQVGGRASGGAGIGGRGPGETKLETDRRRINSRIARLRAQLKELETTRQVHRQERRRRLIPSVAIVGYTNAGKSSLLNRLTGAGVLVEDALFATLDPTTRRTETADGRQYTLTDTVGFIRHLPHDLVEAFRSTLEESAQANLLLHVVDAADADPQGQIEAVRAVLGDIGAGGLPELMVLNKADAADPTALAVLQSRHPGSVVVSARSGAGLDELRLELARRLPRPQVQVTAVIPYSRGDLVDQIHRRGEFVAEPRHVAQGTSVNAWVDRPLAAQIEAARVADAQPEAAPVGGGDSAGA
ncbi:MAG: GTPase HflX [Propionibacteriaceae bacterium]|jgi:GTP-binding protein HflX|nr:GTPase HflX [Propionibacteriaceae bacterium]